MIQTLLRSLASVRVPAFVLAALLLIPSALQAADASNTLFAGYWAGFFDFWEGQFRKQDSIVMLVLGLGVVSIFIITRGKWKK